MHQNAVLITKNFKKNYIERDNHETLETLSHTSSRSSPSNCVIILDLPHLSCIALVSINVVALHQAQLLLPGVTVCTQLCNQQPGLTQPGHPFVCMHSNYQQKLDSKQAHHVMHCPNISTHNHCIIALCKGVPLEPRLYHFFVQSAAAAFINNTITLNSRPTF